MRADHYFKAESLIFVLKERDGNDVLMFDLRK